MVQKAITFQPFELSQYSPRMDQPVLLKQMAAGWPAMKRWTPDYFREKFGRCEVAISHYQSCPEQRPKNKFRSDLATYLDVLEGRAPITEKINQDSYVAGWHFKKNAPELMEDIRIPGVFADNLLDRVDREIINYDSISLFIGHSRAETPLHTDSFAVCVWLANLVGRKTIRVVPPVDYKNIRNAMDAFDERVVRLWADLGIPVIEAVIEPGDIFVIPPGYWHQVKNEGFTVAVSTNFMSPFHFLTFEQQLKAKILAPYLKLLKLKREIVGAQPLDHSADCLKHFDFLNTEGQFLDFLSGEIESERQVLRRARRLTGGVA
jgi:hypothetical protein